MTSQSRSLCSPSARRIAARTVAAMLGASALVLGAPQLAAAAAPAPASVSAAPSAPVVSLVARSGAVQVSWTSTGAELFVVELADASGWRDVSGLLSGDTTSFTVSGLTNGTRVSIRVRAENAAGMATSTVSTAVPVGAPAAPRSLALSLGATSVTARWAAPATNGGAAIRAYVVQRSSDGVHWSTVASALSPTTPQFRITGLRVGVRIHVRVRAITAVGSGAWASTQGVTRSQPGAVVARATSANAGQVRLTWSAPASNGSAIVRYTVQQLRGGTWTTIATLPGTARSYTAVRVPNGTSRTLRVIARNGVGAGPASARVTATARAPRGCDARYGAAIGGSCVPVARDVDCAGGRGNGPAYVRGPVYVLGTDVYRLDSDGDRVACER